MRSIAPLVSNKQAYVVCKSARLRQTCSSIFSYIRILAHLMQIHSVQGETNMSKSILICDDEPLIRMNLKRMLTDLGFDEIFECGDGAKAVEMALGTFPDMAILDVAMPVMDGITAASLIRKQL